MDGFSPTQALGIPRQPYESYYSDDPTLITQTGTGSPMAGVGQTPFYDYSVDPIQMAEMQSQASGRLARLKAQAELRDPNIDWFSPEGRQKRFNYMLQGAISPQEEAQFEHREAIEERARANAAREAIMGSKSMYSNVPPAIAQAVWEIKQIDPHEEDALKKLNERAATLSKDPRLEGTDWTANEYWDRNFQKAKDEIMHARREQSLVAHPHQNKINALATALGEDQYLMHPYLNDEATRITDMKGFNQMLSKVSEIKDLEADYRRQKSKIREENQYWTEPKTAEEADALIKQRGKEPSTMTPQEKTQFIQAMNPENKLRAVEARRRIERAQILGMPSQATQTRMTYPVPPEGAIEELRQKPYTRSQFEARFGPADKYLQ